MNRAMHADQSSRDQAVEVLASRLYENIEKSMPDISGAVSWRMAPENEKQIHRNLIEDLARYVDLWRILVQSSNDH